MKAILVRYMPATATRPSRLKVSADGVGYRYYNTDKVTELEAAQDFAESFYWPPIIASGILPNGDHVFCMEVVQ